MDAEHDDDDALLRELELLADPDELKQFAVMARRFLDADGIDSADYDDREAVLDGLYLMAASAYSVGGRGAPIFFTAMAFVLNPDEVTRAIKAWQRFYGLSEGEQRALVEDCRRRCQEREEPEEGS